MHGSFSPPTCSKCNVPTIFWQTLPASANGHPEVHLFHCSQCQQMFFFCTVNDVLHSWP